MKRRTVLSLVGAVVGGVLAWNWLTAPRLPQGMSVETLHVVGDAMPEKNRECEEGCATIISERTRAQSQIIEQTDVEPRLVGEKEVRSFVSNTEYERSYLIIVRYMASSDATLQLRSIQRTSNGLDLSAAAEYPIGGWVENAIIHTLLIRVTDENESVPNTATVDVETEEGPLE